MKKSLTLATLALGLTTLVAQTGFSAPTQAGTTMKETKVEEKTETKKVEAAENKMPSSDEAQMQKEAKISMAQARGIALKKVPGGKVESGELEREHGKLIYSFDVRTSSKNVTEVNVNAITGKIVAIQHENAAKEAVEKKQEAKESKARTVTSSTGSMHH